MGNISAGRQRSGAGRGTVTIPLRRGRRPGGPYPRDGADKRRRWLRTGALLACLPPGGLCPKRRRRRIKRGHSQAAARLPRPNGPGNRMPQRGQEVARPQAVTDEGAMTGNFPQNRPLIPPSVRTGIPSPRGEGGAVICFRLPFIRRWRWLLLGNGAPGAAAPTESTPPAATVLPSACPSPSPVFHFSFPPKFMLDILPPGVYKCTNTINTLYRGTKNQPKKEAER